MPLFEVAVIEESKETKDTKLPERLIVAPSHVMARDGQGAAMAFVMDHTEQLKGVDRERMKVLVRPFA